MIRSKVLLYSCLVGFSLGAASAAMATPMPTTGTGGTTTPTTSTPTTTATVAVSATVGTIPNPSDYCMASCYLVKVQTATGAPAADGFKYSCQMSACKMGGTNPSCAGGSFNSGEVGPVCDALKGVAGNAGVDPKKCAITIVDNNKNPPATKTQPCP